MDVEHRAHRAELEAIYLRVGQFVAEKVQQKCSEERTMHDEPGIAFHLGHVSPIVVDAMAIEREGGITKQEDVVGYPLPGPRRFGRRRLGRRSDVVGASAPRGTRCREIRSARFRSRPCADFVPHLDEYERPATAALFADVVDRRYPRQRVADPKRPVEFELTAGPHATRQRDGRQEVSPFRVAVGTDLRLAMDRQEIQPMPKGRQSCSGRRPFGGTSSVADNAA